MYISNSFKPTAPSPAWKKMGEQYKLTGPKDQTQIVPKKPTGYSYTPSLSNITGKPLAPALTSKAAPAVTSNTAKPVVAPPTPSYAPPSAPGPVITPPPVAPAVTQTSTPPKSGLVKPGKSGISYNGLVTDLAARSKASAEQKRIQRQLEQEALKNKQIGEEAKNISAMYGKEIATLGKLGAGAVAGDLSTGSSVVGSGNAAIASQSVSDRMQALGKAQEAALQGTGQQLTGQSQAMQGINQALGSANTQQQLGISGLSNAAGYAQPNPAAYGQTVFDPLSGQYSGGNLDPQTQATNLAQQVTSGRMTYDQALASLGYAGSAGANFLNNAITQSGGNPLQLQAQGSAAQSNIGTQNTAQTDISRAGLEAATREYIDMNTAAQFAHQQAAAVNDILDKTGLNNLNSIDANKVLRELGRRLSDTDRTALNTAFQEAQAAYAGLLSAAGGLPTANEQRAMSTLSIDSSAAAIKTSIQELENAVARRLQTKQQARDFYQQNLGGGQAASGGFAETW